MVVTVSLKDMVKNGVHFGHKASRWNPKMKKYIFGQRSGLHIIDLEKTADLFAYALDFIYNTIVEGKTILFATGTKWRKLSEEVKGSKEFENKGVSYCALCDSPLFKNKIVAVVGGSDSAVKDALLLSEHAKKFT